MKILLIAPQPFYQTRGTPIEVNLIIKALSERGDCIDIVTYAEGQDVCYDNTCLYRIPFIPLISDIRPGFSWKKVVCDVFIFFKVFQLIIKSKYHLIHAVEEAVFIALFVHVVFGIPYIYDMDSSLPQQMVDKYPFLSKLRPFMNFFEGIAIKHAKVIVPVCEALACDIEKKYHPNKIVLLPDISLVQCQS
jgi:hypothetical protein